MVTEQGKWLDGKDMFFELTCEIQHYQHLQESGLGNSPCRPDPSLNERGLTFSETSGKG
jgi:hypothetical protein